MNSSHRPYRFCRTTFSFWLLLGALLASGVQPSRGIADDETWHYEKQIRPILKAHCFHCHGEEGVAQGNLDLRLVRQMIAGGDSGKAVEPGSADASILWQRIASDEMPEGPKKLTASQKDAIRKWIDSGAKTARPEPEDPAAARVTEEELEYWAFRSISRPELPPIAAEAANPIDSFIFDSLQRSGMAFSPEADQVTLLRRLYLDLIGLPPSQDETQQFLSDESFDAYERLVDRLLASPQYGVRWGRAWMDVAGYSESDGSTGKDRFRPYAWRYRDYVVQSFNSDLPYDRFLVEQLAGDQLIDGKPDPDNDDHVRLLAATGFLQMSPDVTEQADSLMDRNQAVSDLLKVVGTSVLGLSVGCAQCHDHRYDPITIDDYYRFRAIFDRAMPIQHWTKPSLRTIDMTSTRDRTESDRIEAEAVKMDADIRQRKEELAGQIQERDLLKTPEDVREMLRQAVTTESNQQSEEQKKLLDKYPMIRSKAAIIGQLVEFDNPSHRKFVEEERKVAAFRLTKPLPRLLMTVSDTEHVVESRVFWRGDPLQPKHSVQPGEIFVLARNRPTALESNPQSDHPNPSNPRLAYARQLTDGTHPLLSRVMVNRLWMHHFGRGIVATPNDFGAFGDRPTHPELLDWLASELQRQDWNMKPIHRLMVTSRTYRQQSKRLPNSDSKDPENRLWGRMLVRRLDAEVIRDSILTASGLLNRQINGPSVPVSEDGEGKAVIGIRKLNEGLFAGIESVGAQEFRRSAFLESKRSLPMNMLETFDLPAMNPNCDMRRPSTVAPQSLWFLNDESIVLICERLAERISSGGQASAVSVVRQLYSDLLNRQPNQLELADGIQFLYQQSLRLRSNSEPIWKEKIEKNFMAPELEAAATLGQAMMASNYFLYVD